MPNIGLAIITKDRPDYFMRSVKTVPNDKIQFLCVVNDGTPYSDEVYGQANMAIHLVQHPKNLGIACAKNSALRAMIQAGCDLLFIMEDDVLIKNPDVFNQYIKAAQVSGLWHMNFGFSNIYNYNNDGTRNIRETVDYDDNTSVIFIQNLETKFQFFHKAIIKNVGYMDERYTRFNNLESLDYSYKVVKAGLLPAYWWWPDINNSWEYLTVIPESITNDKTKENINDIQLASSIFIHKFGVNPVEILDTAKEVVVNKLSTLQNTYARQII